MKSENQTTGVDDYKFEQYMHEFLQTPWEEYCDLKNAEQAREDVEEICQIIHKASGISADFLFFGDAD